MKHVTGRDGIGFLIISGDYNNPGENERVAYFINYCLNQEKDGKE